MAIPAKNKIFKDADCKFLDHIELYLELAVGSEAFEVKGVYFDAEHTNAVTGADLIGAPIQDIVFVWNPGSEAGSDPGETRFVAASWSIDSEMLYIVCCLGAGMTVQIMLPLSDAGDNT